MQAERPSGSAPQDLCRQACEELQQRLRAGQPCQAESFLSDNPTLAIEPDLAVELIVAEFAVRSELGQNPDPRDWYTRFPQFSDRLKKAFESKQLLSEVGTANGTVAMGVNSTITGGLNEPLPNLPPHELLEEMGRGAMGVVFRARDKSLNREVALKMIRSGMLAGPEEVSRFFREARTAARLRHPNIVRILHLGMHQGQYCYTMELIPGGSLAERVDRYRDNPRGGAALVEKIARAVHALHVERIVHRDLKPANILIDTNGEPLVGDFGLAKAVDRSADLTQPGMLLGTVAYMSPEQAAGHSCNVSERSDVWALGVILYELLTGQRPFPGKEVEQVARLVVTAKPAPARRLNPALHEDLEAILRKCLEKDPRDRYATAEALADDLARWLRGERRPRESLYRNFRRSATPARMLAISGGILVIALLTPLLLQLKSQNEVEFFDAKGLKSPPEWLIDQGTLTLNEGALELAGGGEETLAQLRANVPWTSFRFEAEIRDVGGPFSFVGLFVAHEAIQTEKSREHWYGVFGFSETPAFGDKERSGRANLTYHCCSVGKKNAKCYYEIAGRERHFTVDAERPWRKIALVVKPGIIRAYWEEGPDAATTLLKDETLKHVREYTFQEYQSAPTLNMQRGIGLYARGGVGLFKNIKLSKVPEDNLPADDVAGGQRTSAIFPEASRGLDHAHANRPAQ